MNDDVNIEVDVIAKYVEKLVKSTPPMSLFGVQQEAGISPPALPGLAPRRVNWAVLPQFRSPRQLRAGRPIVVIDDENRENEGDMIFAAGLVTAELTRS